jgi:hypothetical protein
MKKVPWENALLICTHTIYMYIHEVNVDINQNGYSPFTNDA